MPGWLRLLERGGWGLAALAGAATTAAFAPFGLWPLAFLGPALLFLLWERATPRGAARLGLAYGAGLFLTGSYWLYTAIHEYGQAPAWLALLLLAALVAIMASYYGLLGLAVVRSGAAGPRRWLLCLPGGWLLLEWLRGWLFSGFPWLQLGYAHSDNSLAWLAPVGGIHLVTLASALSAGALVAIIQLQGRRRLLAAGVLLLPWGVALLLAGRAWTTPAGAPLGVGLVQGAIPQDLKWQDDNREATLALYRDLNRQALGRPLIVWPEAALPVLAHEVPDYLAGVRAESRAAGSDLLIGLLHYDFEAERYYNGLLALTAGPAAWYDKRRLVPFGEFFPVPDLVRRWMRLMSLPYVDMSPGAEGQPALAAAGQRIGVTICYEDAYGAEQLAVLGEATLLVNVTNNAWFGDSAAPHQQLQMARFRALEAGRDLARATSNGITAVIGADGRIRARARQFEPEVLLSELQPREGLTPYARTGNLPVLALALLMLLAAGLRRRSPPPGG